MPNRYWNQLDMTLMGWLGGKTSTKIQTDTEFIFLKQLN